MLTGICEGWAMLTILLPLYWIRLMHCIFKHWHVAIDYYLYSFTLSPHRRLSWMPRQDEVKASNLGLDEEIKKWIPRIFTI
jgi:hypothetical protein